MKTLPLVFIAVVFTSLLPSCSIGTDRTVDLKGQHLISDQSDGSYRVRRYLTNESPRETIVKVERIR